MEEQPEEETFSALPDPPKYLVTGGCGFVGRKIVEALRKGGQRVLVLDHKPYPEIPAWPGNDSAVTQWQLLLRRSVERS